MAIRSSSDHFVRNFFRVFHQPAKDPGATFLSEIASIRDELLHVFAIKDFGTVTNRLERLLGKRAIEIEIPELDSWYPRSVNHGIGFLNLTPRVQAVIQHPIFRRLRSVKQLGNLDEVYSGAVHTRYAHTEGVTGMICHCLQALYNDPDNPIFKVLATSDDFSEMITAALLHDIGQSDHGHDLEELDGAFNHSAIGKELLDFEPIRDALKRSLKDVVSGTSHDEWNLDVKRVEGILSRDGEIDRFHAFRDLLDGPLDADKLDYLQRDGICSGVLHSQSLDTHRLLRCLTILPVQDSETHQHQLRLGIKEKGLSSSEMVVIVRQKMYQSLYLHHTGRELKAMITNACALALRKLTPMITDISALLKSEIIRDLFVAHLTFTSPKFKSHGINEADRKKLTKLWEKYFRNLPTSRHGLDWSLRFFEPFLDDRSLRLLSDAGERRVYKRLWERSFAALGRESVERIKQMFSWSNREGTINAIHDDLLRIVAKRIEDKNPAAASMAVPPTGVPAFENLPDRILLLGDMPFRGLGAGGKAPPVLSDIARKRGDYKQGSGSGMGHIWNEGAAKMMDEACFCRIFAEPRFHDYLFSITDQDSVDMAVARILKLNG